MHASCHLCMLALPPAAAAAAAARPFASHFLRCARTCTAFAIHCNAAATSSESSRSSQFINPRLIFSRLVSLRRQLWPSLLVSCLALCMNTFNAQGPSPVAPVISDTASCFTCQVISTKQSHFTLLVSCSVFAQASFPSIDRRSHYDSEWHRYPALFLTFPPFYTRILLFCYSPILAVCPFLAFDAQRCSAPPSFMAVLYESCAISPF